MAPSTNGGLQQRPAIRKRFLTSGSLQVDTLASPDPTVDHLAQFFPEFSNQVLQRTLLAANGDVAAAAQELLAALSEETGTPAPLSQKARAPRSCASIPTAPPDLTSFPSLAATSARDATASSTIPASTLPASHTHTRAASRWQGPRSAAIRAAPPPELWTSRPPPSFQATDAPVPPRQPAMDAASSPVAWVDTGSAVSQQYRAARDTAGALARARNVCFEQATAAYQSGHKAHAKELGAKGRALNDRMKSEHAAASAAIFSSRNVALLAKPATSAVGCSPRTIDLHGLHVSEALEFLEKELEALPRQQQQSSLFILVGTGHHTKGSRLAVRLPAAVAAHLDRKGLRYREAQPGLLCVKPR